MEAGRAGHRAKGSSEFAATVLSDQEAVGEHWRVVAEPD